MQGKHIDDVEVITRWGKYLKPFEEISVDGGKTWWSKEQFKNLQDIITTEQLAILERVVKEIDNCARCFEEKESHYVHIQAEIDSIKQEDKDNG